MTNDAPYRFLVLHPPDVVFLESKSSDDTQMMGIVGELKRRAEEGGPYYLIVDFAQMKHANVGKEQLEEAQKIVKPAWILGSVYLNATMPVRLMVKVFNLAMFLMGKVDYPSEFVATREEAFETIERYRAERAKTKG